MRGDPTQTRYSKFTKPRSRFIAQKQITAIQRFGCPTSSLCLQGYEQGSFKQCTTGHSPFLLLFSVTKNLKKLRILRLHTAEVVGSNPAEPIGFLAFFGRLELFIALDHPEPYLPRFCVICLIEVQRKTLERRQSLFDRYLQMSASSLSCLGKRMIG